jgi:hypothetical protein
MARCLKVQLGNVFDKLFRGHNIYGASILLHFDHDLAYAISMMVILSRKH